jgi:23S rRNA (cytidine1920-2'-O)/16S rRNA (cytidine1409-2'-O)-methyltransferase
VLLVKPQFEAGRADVGAGGIVRDPAVHRRVIEEVWAFFSATPLSPLDVVESPIKGGEGNTEFLMHLRLGAVPGDLRRGLEALGLAAS